MLVPASFVTSSLSLGRKFKYFCHVIAHLFLSDTRFWVPAIISVVIDGYIIDVPLIHPFPDIALSPDATSSKSMIQSPTSSSSLSHLHFLHI